MSVVFDCTRDLFCQIYLALWSIEHENQLAEFYSPSTTHVQYVYPLVRHVNKLIQVVFEVYASLRHLQHVVASNSVAFSSS